MPAIERTRIGLWIEPLDVLMFRDGRPFGPASRADGGLPRPQTLAGALRTAMLAASGFDFGAFPRRLAPDVTPIEAMNECGAPPGLTETLFRGPGSAVQTGVLAGRALAGDTPEPVPGQG